MHDVLDMHVHAMQKFGMTLNEYMTKTGESSSSLASKTGLSQSQISRLRNGRSNPSLAAILAITKATKGKVKATDWQAVEQAA